jgi:hypothetical protein
MFRRRGLPVRERTAQDDRPNDSETGRQPATALRYIIVGGLLVLLLALTISSPQGRAAFRRRRRDLRHSHGAVVAGLPPRPPSTTTTRGAKLAAPLAIGAGWSNAPGRSAASESAPRPSRALAYWPPYWPLNRPPGSRRPWGSAPVQWASSSRSSLSCSTSRRAAMRATAPPTTGR